MKFIRRKESKEQPRREPTEEEYDLYCKRLAREDEIIKRKQEITRAAHKLKDLQDSLWRFEHGPRG